MLLLAVLSASTACVDSAEVPATDSANLDGSSGDDDSEHGNDHADEHGQTDEGTAGADETDKDGDPSTADDGVVHSSNRAPLYLGPRRLHATEEQSWTWSFDLVDPDGDPLRAYLLAEPPGARWDEESRTLTFRPDFTQGGKTYASQLYLDDGEVRVRVGIEIEVHDTIAPPAPELLLISKDSSSARYRLRQWTDGFLDPPALAGRAVDAILIVPNAANEEHKLPLRVVLHGLSASPSIAASSSELRLAPSDPDNSYWWGTASDGPAPSGLRGVVAPTTARRVLHLIDFVLHEFPGADPDRVYVSGSSMGGAGALILGLLWARHFAWIDLQYGQSIAANHRPARITQLSQHWGAPQDALLDDRGMPVWERLDMTRALVDEAEARDQLVFSLHGKDDPTIHFGAVVGASELTGRSFYQALEEFGIAHRSIWDERGHGGVDPVLGSQWWDEAGSPALKATTFVRRGQAHLGFSHDELNDDPGTGSANGQVEWDANSGYAGNPLIAGDTGWDGDLAGALSRHLRWDSTTMIDEIDRFEVTLWREVGPGAPSPGPGYPSVMQEPNGAVPARVDVTLRRAQAFRCRAHEAVYWRLGAQAQGVVAANERGEVTLPNLNVGAEPLRLELSRTGQRSSPIP